MSSKKVTSQRINNGQSAEAQGQGSASFARVTTYPILRFELHAVLKVAIAVLTVLRSPK